MEPALEMVVSADEELRARLERAASEARARVAEADARSQKSDRDRGAAFESEVALRVASILAAAGSEQEERAARRSRAVGERLAAARARLAEARDAFVKLVREGPES